MSKKLLVPDIGEFENVEVIELLVKEGQEIKKNDPIVTIESDKSSVEVPSTIEGKVEKINIKIGDKVSKGDLLLTVLSLEASLKSPEEVPKSTENLIREAETSLKKSQEEVVKKPKFQPQKNENKFFKDERIQVINKGDIDPLETYEWLDTSTPPGSYHLLNFASSIGFKSNKGGIYKINLRVENILNNLYKDYLNRLRYFTHEMGRNILVSLSYSY